MPDNNDFYSRMYGKANKAVQQMKSALPVDDKPKRAFRVLGGMKITGSHIQKLELDNGNNVEFPSVTYVKTLEDEIKTLRKQLRENEYAINNLQNTIARMSTNMDKIKSDMQTKLHTRF